MPTTLTLKVTDAPGVLVRVAHIFARRSANISQIHVTHPADSPWSRMAITINDDANIDQLKGQLEKLVDVYSVAKMY